MTVLSVVGDIPPELDIEAIALRVFEAILSDDRIIEDLSLPPRPRLSGDFQQTMKFIQFQFTRFQLDEMVPVSKTVHHDGPSQFRAEVQIYYSEEELANAQTIVYARILREATHAIRHAIICCANKSEIPITQTLVVTPEKRREEFQHPLFRDGEPLYKMESRSFHSGYYMEHVLLGGIVIKLTGFLLLSNGCISSIPAYGQLFTVKQKGGQHYATTKEGTALTFYELEGFDAAGNNATVLHCGNRTTEEDECGTFVV